jgi:hypothetical protein
LRAASSPSSAAVADAGVDDALLGHFVWACSIVNYRPKALLEAYATSIPSRLLRPDLKPVQVCLCVCLCVCVCVRACVRACVCIQARVRKPVSFCFEFISVLRHKPAKPPAAS